MKFKVGDRVRTTGGFSFDPAVGIVRKVDSWGYELEILKGTGKGYDPKGEDWSYGESQLQLEKAARGINLDIKKGGKMSLLKKLLKPEDALIEKHAMCDGNLQFDGELVQQALLKTDGFKKALVRLCKEAEAEE